MYYKEIPKRTKNSVRARIKATVEKYGFDETKSVVTKYFNEEMDKWKLQKQIADAEKDLAKLKKEAKN